jgi:predicted PurR-regulated permease PerM
VNRLARNTALILATLTVLAGVWIFREAVVIFLLALTFSALMQPTIDAWAARGLGLGKAVLVTYAVLLLMVALGAAAAGSRMFFELQQALGDFAGTLDQVSRQWPHGNSIQRAIAEQIPRLEDLSHTVAELPPAALFQQTLGLAGGLLGLLINIGLIVVLSLYWSLDQRRLARLWLSLIPLDQRTRVESAGEAVASRLGRYMRSELLQSAIAAVTLAGLYAAMRVPYPVTLAVLAGLAWIIPWLGPGLAVGAIWSAVAVNLGDASLLSNLARGIATTALTLALFAVLELAVQPRLMNHDRYSALLVVLVSLGMIDLVGFWGLIAGPPLAVTVEILAGHFLRPPPVAEAPPSLNVLQHDLLNVRAQLLVDNTPWSVPLRSITDRLEQILTEARAAVAGRD